jgi:hypothetical protein
MGVLLIEAPVTHTADFFDALISYASRRPIRVMSGRWTSGAPTPCRC